MNQTLSRKLLGPLERFFRVEASSGIVLLCATVVALVWANSRWHASYESLKHLHSLVNDGLMTVFFFLVGLEIRREMRDGALASARAAVVPLIAALGGMIVPALVFVAVADSSLRRGWAIPTATDIAFAVGALTLIGKRAPPPARAFLLALAVIDDIGAILVIAVFYSSDGGIHPTLAGVILGLLLPARAGERLEDALHPWVAYAIMPLFALVNAGVALGGINFNAANVDVLVAAIGLALVFGKPLGITLFTWLATRSGIGVLPTGLDSRGVLLVGCLGGIGFTMSLFLATLAFADSQLLAAAKAAVLLGSAIAAVTAFTLGTFSRSPEQPSQPPR